MSTHPTRSRFSEATLSFITSLGIVVLFAPWLIIVYSVVAPYVAGLDQNDQGVIRGFIEWFGTAYSFFLALAIVNVWSQFETVDREFDRELDAISTLLQTVKHIGVSDDAKKPQLQKFKSIVLKEIKEYVTQVVNNFRFEHQVSRQHQNGDRILERIGSQISSLTINQVVPEPFIDELFRSLNEAMDVRGDRISHSKPYAPVIIQFMAVIASMIWLLSFLGLVIYDRWVAAFLIGGVAFVIAMILIIFFDLGEPFGGFWKIHLDDWDEFLNNMKHASDPEVVFIYNLENTLAGQLRSWNGKDTCKLNDLAHTGRSGKPWKKFLAGVEAPRSRREAIVRCVTVYSNDLSEMGLHITSPERPLVVLIQGTKQVVLLNSKDINQCKDLIEFEEAFNKKMKARLRWF
jgi:hypothetical protein